MSNDDYRLSGVATAISIVHGGASPKCLSRHLFQALVDGPDQVTVQVDDMPDGDLKSDLFKMITCNTVEEANEVAEQLTTIMEMCGCSTVLKELKDFGTLANTISTWFCLGRTRPAFDRFICGLGTLGLLDSIRQHPDVFQPLLCYTERKVTRDEMVALFSPVLSRQGSNKRAKENDIYGWFMDLLQDCAEQNGPLDLEDILFFATGSRQIHPLGFTSKPELTFMHDNATSGITSSLYRMANTCSCVLRLPVAHNSYDELKEHFVFAVKNAQGFGFS